jgi:type III secretion protein Q
MTRPLTLPRLAASETQALGRLAQGAIELPVASWPATESSGIPLLTLRHLGVAPSPLDASDAVRTILEWSGARMVVDVPMQAAQDWTQVTMGGPREAALPETWRRYAMERAVQWLANTLSAMGKGKARIVEGGSAAQEPAPGCRHHFVLSLDFPSTGVSVQAVLHCDSLGLLLMAGAIPRDFAARPGPVQRSELPARLSLCLGWTDLPLAQWRGLERGDVVFITHTFADNQRGIALQLHSPVGPARCLMGTLHEYTLTLTSEAFAMSDFPDQPEGLEPQALGEAMAAPPLEQVGIRLTFDVGQRTMTLAEVEQLQPGMVMQLERAATDYVCIRANGQAVGTGTLVEVDGKLGVMVSALNEGHSP